jgi:hypothetical protein
VDEANERFVLRLSSASGASLAQPDGWATIVDDDGGSRPIQEAAHGQRARHDFATGPDHLYLIRQDGYSSYEVVADSAFGHGSSATGPSLARLASDGATVLQSAIGVGTGKARQLRFLNDDAAAQTGEYVRVRSGACSSDCTPGDGYRLRAYDTTYRIPRFNNLGSQTSVLFVQNPTNRAASIRARFWSASGGLLYSHSAIVGPHSLFTLGTAGVSALAGQSGSVTIANDAGYGELAGKVVSVDSGTGMAFDSPMLARSR